MSTNKIGATPEMRDTPKFGLGLAFNLPTFSHCPHQKKKIFALKHFSDPIYQTNKKLFSHFRGGRGGAYRRVGIFPLFFFNDPFPYTYTTTTKMAFTAGVL